MKNTYKLLIFIASFAFIFIGYASILYWLLQFLAPFMDININTVFYILLIPNFFFTMFTIMYIDKNRPKIKSNFIWFVILLLLMNIRFFAFILPHLLRNN
jgi:hypothetical protein